MNYELYYEWTSLRSTAWPDFSGKYVRKSVTFFYHRIHRFKISQNTQFNRYK